MTDNHIDPASWAAIRDLDLEAVIRSIVYNDDSRAGRQAVRESIAGDVSRLARLEHDTEALHSAITPELAQQIRLAMEQQDLMRCAGSDLARRSHQWKLAATLAHVGAIVVDAVEKAIDREIDRVVAEREVESYDLAG